MYARTREYACAHESANERERAEDARNKRGSLVVAENRDASAGEREKQHRARAEDEERVS